MNEVSVIDEESIKNKIFTIRGLQVMLDRDLAELYGVETKVFNQAVKRNESRFPDDFRFQLTGIEKNELVTNCDRFNTLKHSSVNPYAFTEQGVSMLSVILKSDIAIEMSIKIIRSFVQMRKLISNNALIFQRLDMLEQKQLKNDEKIDAVLNALENETVKPKQGIFYDGQIYDAYLFVCELVRSAKKSIILIDNYCDESVLTLLLKRGLHVSAKIYTINTTKQLTLDLQKHNAQYPKIELERFDASHDRFLIIDDKEVYHIGASLKDLGKKWFAFSKFDMEALDILSRLGK